MPDYAFNDARPKDCLELSRLLRAGDAKECWDAGISPKRAIWRTYRCSLLSVVARYDGEIAAMGGMGGEFMSDVGIPWLFTTKVVEKHPVAFIKHVREMVGYMLETKSRLENFVSADYPEAVRLVETIGFRVEEPRPWGLRGNLFRKFWMER